jgi:hypothetical protein
MRLLCLPWGFSLATLLALGGCQLLVDADAAEIGGPDSDPRDHDTDENPISGPDAGDDDDDNSDESDDDPCAALVCDPGTHCESRECDTDPCDQPIAGCVADDDDDDTDEGPAPPTCDSVVCKEGTDCVDTDQGPKCIPPQDNPCSTYDCPAGQVCMLSGGEPECVDEDPCAAITCEPGTVCEARAGVAECVSDDPCRDHSCEDGSHCELIWPPCAPPPDGEINPNCKPLPECVPDPTCETIDCGAGNYCDDSSGSAECKPKPTCDDLECGKGYKCELVDVACLVPPCPPAQPVCLFIPIPCGFDTCMEGEHCESGWSCQPDIQCGDNVCGAGEYCCNASCGICAKTGKHCSQQQCDNN